MSGHNKSTVERKHEEQVHLRRHVLCSNILRLFQWLDTVLCQDAAVLRYYLPDLPHFGAPIFKTPIWCTHERQALNIFLANRPRQPTPLQMPPSCPTQLPPMHATDWQGAACRIGSGHVGAQLSLTSAHQASPELPLCYRPGTLHGKGPSGHGFSPATPHSGDHEQICGGCVSTAHCKAPSVTTVPSALTVCAVGTVVDTIDDPAGLAALAAVSRTFSCC